MKKKIFSVLSLMMLGVVALTLISGCSGKKNAPAQEKSTGYENTQANSVTTNKLNENTQANKDKTLDWFLHNPPAGDGSNFKERWEHAKVIDSLLEKNKFDPNTWDEYKHNMSNTDVCDKIASKNPILYYLRNAEKNTVNEIRNTTVAKGVVIWKMYNLGYIIKTKDKCFAIDLNMAGSESLVDILDFAVVSHEHGDHFTKAFMDAMVKAKKPVFTTSFYKSGTVIQDTSEYSFGEVSLRFTMTKQNEIPCLATQIDCGPSADNYSIYHVGDSNVVSDLNPNKHVNLFICHIRCGLNLEEATAKLNPDKTVYDHEMELGHWQEKFTWLSYEYAFKRIESMPHDKSIVLTWGERLDLWGNLK